MEEEQRSYLKLYAAKNMSDMELVECEPWEFPNTIGGENPYPKMEKKARRLHLLKPDTEWNVYSAWRGLNPHQRISKDNPVVALRAIVIDYDARTTPEAADKLCQENLPPEQRPNMCEVTHSQKMRLIWCMEREVNVISNAHGTEIMESFCTKFKLRTLLPGFDENSLKPSEVWTNGGEWYFFDKKSPLTKEFLVGMAIQASKKASLFNRGDVPLDVIAKELEVRFPGRWEGEFKLDAVGVRFWDPNADNPTGCQVKPDGMLCFTGNEPFKKWADIFGKQWCESQKAVKLGNVAKGMYFNGHDYFEPGPNETILDTPKDAIITRLKSAGLSDKVEKGQTQSEVGEVMNFIQTSHRVLGAAPLINYPPGIVTLPGGTDRILNISSIRPVQPRAPKGLHKDECPFLWWFFFEHQFVGEGTPALLYWMLRSSQNYRFHRRELGQAIFICGPINSGKTLFILRMLTPILGYKSANPIKYLMGETHFSDSLFTSGLLAVNDSDYPKTEGLRLKVLHGYKDFVVNPYRTYHPKFQKQTEIECVTRLATSLNAGPGSAGCLPEVNEDTRDKFMFFSAKSVEQGKFPPKSVLEPQLEQELPVFLHYLENEWTPPATTVNVPQAYERVGIVSYYDPYLLALAHNQTYSANLSELLNEWMKVYEDFQENGEGFWIGTPTALLSALQTCDLTAKITKDWDQNKIARNLTALSRVDGSGVSLTGKKTGRFFKIQKPDNYDETEG